MAERQVQGYTEHSDNTAREATEIKIAKETAAARKKRVREAWEDTMRTPEGRAVVFDMLAQYLGGSRGTYSVGMQPHDIVANAAVQSQGAALVNFLVTEYPAYYRAMLQENG